jgi:hypothetical protein
VGCFGFVVVLNTSKPCQGQNKVSTWKNYMDLTNKEFNNEYELNDFIAWKKNDANYTWNGLRIQRAQLALLKSKGGALQTFTSIIYRI